MRWTQTLIPTLKETHADATVISHQLMLRAGMIRQLAAGVYDFLPLGLRSLHKAAAIVREEMNKLGAAEVLLPALTPIELWQRSGRVAEYGKILFHLKDQHGRVAALAPTHEEVITELVGAYVNSYKQLPLVLYQIQTKFRDEERPRFGLLRVREFLMKDAYSFHADEESLDATYRQMVAAYEKIFTRCGVPFVAAEAEAGPIGGSASHEFVTISDAGEDVIVTSDKGNYAANVERADIGPRPWTFLGEPTGTLEKVHTPNLPGVEEVARFMKVKPRNMLKTLVCWSAERHRWVFAVVRGDHELNLAKLRRALRDDTIALADEGAARAAGFAIGFVGPHALAGRTTWTMVIDPDAAQSGAFWVTGANEADHHAKHFHWGRDFFDPADINPVELSSRMPFMQYDNEAVAVADIRNAQSGDPSPREGGGVLQTARAIEIGHVFKLGTRYSDAFDAKFLDDRGQPHRILMGSYGIGIGRILVAAIEAFHDDRGIIWPAALAPYSVVITPIKYDGEVKAAADALYVQLTAAGIDVLLDDRPDARPGVKFADADLIGIPVRINLGERGLQDGNVEVKLRRDTEASVVPLARAVERAQQLLMDL